MLKKLPILIITLSILWGCADELINTPAGNQLKGAIKTFVLKTASATTKTIWEYDDKTKRVTGFKAYNVADNVLINSEGYYLFSRVSRVRLPKAMQEDSAAREASEIPLLFTGQFARETLRGLKCKKNV